MSPSQNKPTTSSILFIMDNNGIPDWELLYKKFASMMYRAILRIVKDENAAEEILTQSFVLLKEKDFLNSLRRPLFISLLQHASNTALVYMNEKGKKYEEFNKKLPLLDELLYTNQTFREIIHAADLEKEEAQKILIQELRQLRNVGQLN